MKLKPSSCDAENAAFQEALKKVLSVSHVELQARLPAKKARTGKRSGDSPSASVPSTGGASC